MLGRMTGDVSAETDKLRRYKTYGVFGRDRSNGALAPPEKQ